MLKISKDAADKNGNFSGTCEQGLLPFIVAHNPTRWQNMGINVCGKLKDLLNGESGLDPQLPEQFPCSMCWCNFMTIYSLLKVYSQVLSKVLTVLKRLNAFLWARSHMMLKHVKKIKRPLTKTVTLTVILFATLR